MSYFMSVPELPSPKAPQDHHQSSVYLTDLSVDRVQQLSTYCERLILSGSVLNTQGDQALIERLPVELIFNECALYHIYFTGNLLHKTSLIHVQRCDLTRVAFTDLYVAQVIVDESMLTDVKISNSSVEDRLMLANLDQESMIHLLDIEGGSGQLELMGSLGQKVHIERSEFQRLTLDHPTLPELLVTQSQLGGIKTNRGYIDRWRVEESHLIQSAQESAQEADQEVAHDVESTPISERTKAGYLELEECTINGPFWSDIHILGGAHLQSCQLEDQALKDGRCSGPLRLVECDLTGDEIMSGLSNLGRCTLESVTLNQARQLFQHAHLEGGLTLTQLKVNDTLDLSDLTVFHDLWLGEWTLVEVSQNTMSSEVSLEQKGQVSSTYIRPTILIDLSRSHCTDRVTLTPPNLTLKSVHRSEHYHAQGGVNLHLSLDQLWVKDTLNLSQMSSRPSHQFLGSISVSASGIQVSEIICPRDELSSVEASGEAPFTYRLSSELTSSDVLNRSDVARRSLDEYHWLMLATHQARRLARPQEARAYQSLANRALLDAQHTLEPIRSIFTGQRTWSTLSSRDRRGSISIAMFLFKTLVITLCAYVIQRLISPDMNLAHTLHLVTWEAWVSPTLRLLGDVPSQHHTQLVTIALILQRFAAICMIFEAFRDPSTDASRIARRINANLS
jgi:uncharacterized protein YjbI with pentapeptide repeats